MLTPSSGSMTSLSPSSTWSKSAGASAIAIVLIYARAGKIAIVALVFEPIGEFRPAFFCDPAVNENVHKVGLDVAQNAGVVGDQKDAEPSALLRSVHSFGDDLEGIHVEAGVGLVENREARLEQFQLQDLVAFLLASGEPLVDIPRGERLV